MTQTPKVIMAVVLSLVGWVGTLVFLTGQGLDRAEKWVSLVGVFISIAIGLAGLVLGWLTWRRTPPGAGVAAGRVRRTGSATATGAGSSAISGSVGPASGAVVELTGDAKAAGGARAVSGEDRSGRPA